MKKIALVLSAVFLISGLLACGAQQPTATTLDTQEDSAVLIAGYARVNITPDYAVTMSGYGNDAVRISSGFSSYLYATCVALSDGEDTVIVIQTDLSQADPDVVAEVRGWVKTKHGIPAENVMIAATHSHSSPTVSGTNASMQYRADLIGWLKEAAGEAITDMKPVSGIYYGSQHCPGLNFVRHYTTESGVIKGDGLNVLLDSPYTGHTHDADDLMQIARIERDGANTIVMANWQSHPHRGTDEASTELSSDIVGVMTAYVEAEMDGVNFIYFTGAAGNLNPHSRISEENITKDYKEQGNALGKYAVSILNGEMTKVEGTNVQVTTSTFVADINHEDDYRVEDAQKVIEAWEASYDAAEARKVAYTYGMQSFLHAQRIIERSGMGLTQDIVLSAFSVGDFGFVAAPYEMFDTQGVTIREDSPFAATFVISCCNGVDGYIPSMEGFQNETYEAYSSRFKPGTGESLAEEFGKMLDQLYETK